MTRAVLVVALGVVLAACGGESTSGSSGAGDDRLAGFVHDLSLASIGCGPDAEPTCEASHDEQLADARAEWSAVLPVLREDPCVDERDSIAGEASDLVSSGDADRVELGEVLLDDLGSLEAC